MPPSSIQLPFFYVLQLPSQLAARNVDVILIAVNIMFSCSTNHELYALIIIFLVCLIRQHQF